MFRGTNTPASPQKKSTGFKSSITDIRAVRGLYIGSDHNLLKIKFKVKLRVKSKNKYKRKENL
jgi:hypothetical protein